MRNILITGANFVNKGAQAMLFVTVSEIRSRYPDANIYYTTKENVSISDDFKFTALDKYTFMNAFEKSAGQKNAPSFFFEASKQALRALIKRNYRAIYSDYKNINLIDRLDLILDISGYNLSSLFSRKANDYYLRIIDCASKCKIPVILLPQSFGPFDYGKNTSAYVQNITETLKHPLLIFAREKGSYELLAEQLSLANTVLSDDLVLQNRGIRWDFIYKNGFLPHVDFNITTSNNVGLVPNIKIMDKCPNVDIYSLYNNLIITLLQKNKSVYLLCHSSEDYMICQKIKAGFETQASVVLLSQSTNCYEYTSIVSRFDYIISSRFHAIVHAFKENVPCLGLGWADKYVELFHSLGQQDYIIDLRKKISELQIIDRLHVLDNKHMLERDSLKRNLELIQSSNCFDLAFQTIERAGKQEKDQM